MYHDSATARAALVRHLRLPPEAAARLAHLEADLPPLYFERVVALLHDTAEANFNHCLAGEDARWEKLVAHLPGLAPALSLLWSHVRGGEMRPDCTSVWGRCQLGPEPPPDY